MAELLQSSSGSRCSQKSLSPLGIGHILAVCKQCLIFAKRIRILSVKCECIRLPDPVGLWRLPGRPRCGTGTPLACRPESTGLWQRIEVCHNICKTLCVGQLGVFLSLPRTGASEDHAGTIHF